MYSGPASGLWTNPNPFSSVPAGSLAKADNVVFVAPSVIEPRRGMSEMATSAFGSTGSLADALAFYGSSILVAYDLTTVALRPAAGSFTDFSDTFVPNGANRMRFEGAARSVFFNPDSGIRFFDGVDQPKMAGNHQGLNITALQTYTDGWLMPDTAVAYRFTICSKDAFGRVIEGPPSGRFVIDSDIRVGRGFLTLSSNVVTAAFASVAVPYSPGLQPAIGEVVELLAPGETSFPVGLKTVTDSSSGLFRYAETAANATSDIRHTFHRGNAVANILTLTMPEGVTTINFLRVYRSEMTLTSDATPSDELWQCYESGYLTDTDVSNGYLTFTDIAPESTLEVPLYTNPNTGDGTLAANFQPPIAEDIIYWQNRMWFLNTTDKHNATVTLLGIGSPDGLQNGDTVSFVVGATSHVFTATDIAILDPDQFFLYSDADPGLNITLTAQGLCQAINTSAANEDVYAFYVSSEAGMPGKILLVAREFGDAHAFSLFSDRTTAWTPQLPDPSTPLWPALASTDNRHAARLCYSKLGEPEAVPLLNYLEIDADNNPALKLAALNYRLLVFKTDGIYFVADSENPSMQKLSDHVLIAPDSVQRLGDVVYCLTDQGVMAISDAGIAPVSIPIDDLLTRLGGTQSLADLKTRTVGCSYRSARQYLLWLIDEDGLGGFSDDNSQALVYSTLSSGFTRYTFGARAACVDSTTDTLVMAPTDDNVLWQENKTQTTADYVDGTDTAIDCDLIFNELTDGEPATMKLAQQCSFLFKYNGINTITASFSSEIHPARIEVPLETQGWGDFPWGEVPWGGFVRTVRRVQPLPVGAANCCQLSVGFSTSQARAKFSFLGIDVVSGGDTVANRG